MHIWGVGLPHCGCKGELSICQGFSLSFPRKSLMCPPTPAGPKPAPAPPAQRSLPSATQVAGKRSQSEAPAAGAPSQGPPAKRPRPGPGPQREAASYSNSDISPELVGFTQTLHCTTQAAAVTPPRHASIADIFVLFLRVQLIMFLWAEAWRQRAGCFGAGREVPAGSQAARPPRGVSRRLPLGQPAPGAAQ